MTPTHTGRCPGPNYADAPATNLTEVKQKVELTLRLLVDGMGVGDAIDFTRWLIDLAREMGGYAEQDAGKPT